MLFVFIILEYEISYSVAKMTVARNWANDCSYRQYVEVSGQISMGHISTRQIFTRLMSTQTNFHSVKNPLRQISTVTYFHWTHLHQTIFHSDKNPLRQFSTIPYFYWDKFPRRLISTSHISTRHISTRQISTRHISTRQISTQGGPKKRNPNSCL